MAVWAVVVYALAVARVTGLIVADELTEPAREYLRHHLGTTGLGWFLRGIINCPWCASIWVAAVAAPIAYWWGAQPWALIPAAALAFSQVAGMVSDVGRM